MDKFTETEHTGGIYTYITCATDTEMIKQVFARITQALLFQGLSASGLD